MKLKIGPKQEKQKIGFTDPATGFTVSPGQVKEAGTKLGSATRAALKIGWLIEVTEPPRSEATPGDDLKPQASNLKPKKKRGFLR